MKKFGKASIGVLALVLGLGLLLSSCHKPTAELQQAEAALAKAKAAGAQDKASSQYSSAESKLAEAKKLIDQGQYKKAKQLLEEATQQAKMAEQTAIAANQPKPVVSATKTEEASAMGKTETKMTQEIKGADHHVVVKGECLWKISGYKQVYNDPFQWPVIYQANKDQIKNPDRIKPKQDFKISRDATDEELKAARKKAGAGAPYWPPGPNDYSKHKVVHKAVKKEAPPKEAAPAAPAEAPVPAAPANP